MERPALVDWLRRRVLNHAHLWGAGAGQRLPGIRELAQESSVDHRAIASAYRVLEAEGLVEVRGRSGVYLGEIERDPLDLLPGTAHWLSGLLESARNRRLSLPDLLDLLQKVLGGEEIRCACVESNEDQMVAYEWELRHSYGMSVSRVYVSPDAPSRRDSAVVRKALEGVSLAVTTRYHSGLVSPIAEELGIPAVIIAIDAEAVKDVAQILRQRIRESPVTVIIADPHFRTRLQAMAQGVVTHEDDIRYVLADDEAAVEGLDPAASVVVTRAARDYLGKVTPPIFLFHAPVFAPRTVRQLCEHIVGAKLDAPAPAAQPR